MSEQNVSYTTPAARLCFPAIFEPQKSEEDKGDPLYNCILLFDPSSFSQRDIALMAALRKAGFDALRAKFGPDAVKDEAQNKLKGDLRWPILDAAPKAEKWAGFEEGRLYLRVKSKFKPGIGRVVLGDGGKPKIEATEDRDLFYPGAIVRAKVSPWAYKNKTEGVRFTLENILFMAHGERLVQEKTVEDRFGDEDLEGIDYAADLADDDALA